MFRSASNIKLMRLWDQCVVVLRGQYIEQVVCIYLLMFENFKIAKEIMFHVSRYLVFAE